MTQQQDDPRVRETPQCESRVKKVFGIHSSRPDWLGHGVLTFRTKPIDCVYLRWWGRVI